MVALVLLSPLQTCGVLSLRKKIIRLFLLRTEAVCYALFSFAKLNKWVLLTIFRIHQNLLSINNVFINPTRYISMNFV
jgi:hypothetical protein